MFKAPRNQLSLRCRCHNSIRWLKVFTPMETFDGCDAATTCELTRPRSHLTSVAPPWDTCSHPMPRTFLTGGMRSYSLSSISKPARLFISNRHGMFWGIWTEECAPKTQTRRRRVNTLLLTCTLITRLITEGWRWKTIHTCAANDESTRRSWTQRCDCTATHCSCFDLDVLQGDKSDCLHSGHICFTTMTAH